MSSATVTFRSDFDNDYAVDARGSFEKITKQNRRPSYRRSSSPPGSVNGIHKRRNSRWTWGHGASMQNLRSVARCVIAAVATLCAATAAAGPVGISFVEVGNAGNAANTNGRGSVAYPYQMGTTEVTNGQYVQFLNTVDPTGGNALGLYSTQMGLNFRGGITNTGTVNGARYASKTGFDTRPVNFVNWTDAARFVNWLQTGTTTETGVYNVTGANPTLRLAGAQYFLPTQDEWYKAAYYNGSLTSYNTYATGTFVNGSSPALTVALITSASSSNGAVLNPSATTVVYNNAGVGLSTVMNVGSAGSSSSYGAYDMNGNVWEWTETSGTSASTMLTYGGNYGSALSIMGALSSTNNAAQNSTVENQGIGFRVAAVPEPSTIMMAIAGGLVLTGIRVRRKGAVEESKRQRSST